jgi:hypothetical protein
MRCILYYEAICSLNRPLVNWMKLSGHLDKLEPHCKNIAGCTFAIRETTPEEWYGFMISSGSIPKYYDDFFRYALYGLMIEYHHWSFDQISQFTEIRVDTSMERKFPIDKFHEHGSLISCSGKCPLLYMAIESNNMSVLKELWNHGSQVHPMVVARMARYDCFDYSMGMQLFTLEWFAHNPIRLQRRTARHYLERLHAKLTAGESTDVMSCEQYIIQ